MESAPTIIQTSSDSTILSIGRAPNFRARWFLIVGVAMLILSAVLFSLWLALRPTFSIPSNTVLLVSVSPFVANRALNEEQKQALPALWQRLIQNDSHWPMILGLYRNTSGWHAFGLALRWQTDGLEARETKGLVSLVSDETLPHTERGLRYLDQSAWWRVRSNAAFAFWFDPRVLLSADDVLGADVRPFVGYYEQGVVHTDVPLKSSPQEPLHAADVSLNLPDRSESKMLANAILEELSINNLPLYQTDLRPTQINVNHPESKPVHLSFLFKDPITSEQARQILGSLGLTQRNVIQLEDGSLAIEQKLPFTTPESALFGQKTSNIYGAVLINERELRLGSADELKQIAAPTSCSKLEPWARFSSTEVSRLLPILQGATQPFSDIQIGSLKGLLTVCFE